jgi:hypothetical protein
VKLPAPASAPLTLVMMRLLIRVMRGGALTTPHAAMFCKRRASEGG